MLQQLLTDNGVTYEQIVTLSDVLRFDIRLLAYIDQGIQPLPMILVNAISDSFGIEKSAIIDAVKTITFSTDLSLRVPNEFQSNQVFAPVRLAFTQQEFINPEPPRVSLCK